MTAATNRVNKAFQTVKPSRTEATRPVGSKSLGETTASAEGETKLPLTEAMSDDQLINWVRYNGLQRGREGEDGGRRRRAAAAEGKEEESESRGDATLISGQNYWRGQANSLWIGRNAGVWQYGAAGSPRCAGSAEYYD